MARSERSATVFRLPEDLHQRLREAADERMVSMNLLAIKAIEHLLDNLVPVDQIEYIRKEREKVEREDF